MLLGTAGGEDWYLILLLSLYSNPLALRALPLYFAAQNTGGEVETYSLFVSVPILYVKPRKATGHGRGGGQTRTIPVNYRLSRFGGVDIFGV